MSTPPAVVRWDARVKVLLALTFGILTWNAGWPGLALYALALICLAFTLAGFAAANARAARAYLIFAALWTAVKLGLDLWAGLEFTRALAGSALLGGRLAVVLLIGLVLAQSTSARSLGLALAWFMRPVLGRRAWKAALALALMIHFLPLAWSASDGVRLGMRTRGELPWKKRLIVFPAALLSRLAGATWDQTLAVAARGLDRPEAWRPDFKAGALAWPAGLAAATLGLAVSWL